MLAAVAAAVQLAGCIAIALHVARAAGEWAALVGFYLSSVAGLAIGEAAVGAAPDSRKRWIALVTTAGLVGSYAWIASSQRAGDSGTAFVILLPASALLANLVGGWLLGARAPTVTVAPGTGPAKASRSVQAAAGLAASSAAAFVAWNAAVALVTPGYAIEPSLIGDLRTLISAEAGYESVNFGFGDTPECLQQPTRCLPNYPASGPTFLPVKTWTGTAGYFRRRFVPGATVAPADRPVGASPSSLRSYAYVAVPVEPDGIIGLLWRSAGLSLAGVRSFCADSSGRICVTDGGTEPRIVDGLCSSAPGCRDMP